MFSSAAILLASSALLPHVTLAAPADKTWCTFYTEDMCENRSGSVNYEVGNSGTFQNGGAYFNCGSDEEFSLISYHAGDSSGSNPEHCVVFPYMGTDECIHLNDLGFWSGNGGYYRLTFDKVCPSTSDKREPEPEPEPEPPLNLTEVRRAAENDNYLAFFVDPACEQQMGGVHYSIDNTGCFENSGAYIYFGGDSIDWHLEQWTGVDDAWCSGTMETCRDMGDIGFWAGDSFENCVHLDDVGFHSGYGSYRVQHAGCP